MEMQGGLWKYIMENMNPLQTLEFSTEKGSLNGQQKTAIVSENKENSGNV